jgi:hypothetical protein
MLRKTNLFPRAKARYLQVISGVLPTNGWLKSKGLINDVKCPRCAGCTDTVFHQMSCHTDLEDELTGRLNGMEPVDFISAHTGTPTPTRPNL